MPSDSYSGKTRARVAVITITLFLFILNIKRIDTAEIHSFQQGCKLEGLHPLLIVTYKEITISVDKITVPHNERITVRCRELGKYKLIGEPLLHCRNGTWNEKTPYCVPTTAISNYTENVPPTIVFGLPTGSAALEPTGALAVFPGSILHLECLFARKFGEPNWTWTSSRDYLKGWAMSRGNDWKYRLSIYYAKHHDSGVYTCSTPKGLSNSIQVRVVDVRCPVLTEPEPPLISHIGSNRIGDNAIFECPEGYRLEGASGVTCQYNGKWSANVPHCEEIECPAIEVEDNPLLSLIEHNNTYGGNAVFTCMWGYKLSGLQTIRCGGNGRWNASIPTCLEITCPVPETPRSGRIIEQTRYSNKKRYHAPIYKVGALVKFACLPGHQLIGEASLICIENGTWSHRPPVCKIRCPYPGDPPHGRIAPLKFWYKPGDNIQVTCSPGYVTPLEPVKKPSCRENGIWSAPPPPCRSYKEV
ncbi:locomotion-related protein Hikaru genki isoform X2 [Anoplolepis gracilipes]|uniref:locomotion-related protein Hikaru genki isoform X2 n=1 Tax=Anoplolepis gracilipes TaxID=354296 RepID=UPI003B9F7B13